jgi:hypothetical protein
MGPQSPREIATKRPKGERFKRLRVPEAMPTPPADGNFPLERQARRLPGLYASAAGDAGCLDRRLGSDHAPCACGARSPGPTRGYTAEQLEIVFLYGRCCRVKSPRAIREKLGSDSDPNVQQTLGLPKSVKSPQKGTRNPGLPDQRTIYRHKQRLSNEQRATLMRQVFEGLREEALKRPELIEATRTLYLDGTALLTH